jgi:hypothetical protein
MKEKLAALGAFLISILLSFCCTLPLALASLGLGSLGLGAVLKPWRPYLIAAAVVFISAGLWRVRHRNADRKSKALLWTAAGVLALSVAAPYAIGWWSGGTDGAGPLPLDPGERVVVIVLEGELEACPAGCEGRAQLALRGLPGVRYVRVNHGRREAELVLKKDAVLDPADVARVLRAVGHAGRLKE